MRLKKSLAVTFIFLAAGLALALNLGQQAPNFKAMDWKGKNLELAQFHGRQNVLLVFSRYIGCAWCQMFIIDLSKKQAEIAATNTRVLIVTNSEPEVVKQYQPPKDFSFDLIPDRDQKLYELYQVKMEDTKMTGNVFWQTVRFVKYLGDYNWVSRGLEGDHYQPPACFIIGKDGRIKYIHVGTDVADNPKTDEIVKELKKL
jgi:peroxiredoxin